MVKIFADDDFKKVSLIDLIFLVCLEEIYFWAWSCTCLLISWCFYLLLWTLQKGFTPLHIAAKYGQMKVARLLLQKGANPDIQGKNGLTPLHVATHYNHANVAQLLLENKASPHATAKVIKFSCVFWNSADVSSNLVQPL